MSSHEVNSGGADAGLSRRAVLRAAAMATMGAMTSGSGFGQRRPTSRRASAPRATTGPVKPWWMLASPERSRVLDIRHRHVLKSTVVDETALSDMLRQAIQAFTEARDARSAWRAVLGSAQRIVLKFNHVGAELLRTNEVMARVLVQALAEAGYDPASIALVESAPHLAKQLGTRAPEVGWTGSVAVGNSQEPLAAYLREADALINVPLLKTHRIAGMSGCLKNLSHALIRHPARYHGNRCSPYVAQVVGSQDVSEKIRLNIVNAVRLIVDNGPDATNADVFEYGGLLVGYDPVAVDTVGLDTLRRLRNLKKLRGEVQVAYLAAAGEMDIGHRRAAELERLAMEAKE